jgi:magnesium-transporting ATPase (P-type)
LLQQEQPNHYVCVTGDQTTDAPAITTADVGITICSGSDFTKSRAGILLWKNDGFFHTEKIVKYGKGLYQAVRKFLQFELTINFVTLFILMYCAAFFGENCLSGVQIMWINLIMDCFCALALQLEKMQNPTDQELHPFKKDERIGTENMVKNIFYWGIYQVLVCLFFIHCAYPLFGIEYSHLDPFYWDEDNVAWSASQNNGVSTIELGGETGKLEIYTVVFNVIVFMNIFNFFNARILNQKKIVNPISDAWTTADSRVRRCYFEWVHFNKWFCSITIGILIIQVFFVTYGGKLLRTKELTFEEWGMSIIFGAGTIPWNMLVT